MIHLTGLTFLEDDNMGLFTECKCKHFWQPEIIQLGRERITPKEIIEILSKHNINMSAEDLEKTRINDYGINMEMYVGGERIYPDFPTSKFKKACIICDTCLGWNINIEREVCNAVNDAVAIMKRRVAKEEKIIKAKAICE